MKSKTVLKKYDFSIEELKESIVKSDRRHVNLGSIIEQMDEELLDFEPPYQRGQVWKDNYNIDLIRSILDGTPIGAIHFVRKSSDPVNGEKWVLDAKQRLLAVKTLKTGILKLKIKDPLGNIVSLSLNDMKKNKEYRFLYDRIHSYQIDIVTWDHCDFSQQKTIFERVNNSVALNKLEIIYGKNFIVKQLLRYFFNNAFVSKDFLNKSISEDNRNTGIKLIHSLLVLCYGNNLDDVFGIRELSITNIEKSCKSLEKRLLDFGIDANSSDSAFNNQLLESLDIKVSFDTLKTASKWFGQAIEYKNSLSKGKKFESIFILDILAFFVMKIQNNILTNSYVEQNLEKMYQFICDWDTFKNDKANSRSIKSRNTSANSIKTKIEEMERIFAKLDFDNTSKNSGLTRQQKLTASLNADPICPISGSALSDKNIQFDHVNAKSIAGSTKVACLANFANNRKSDQSFKTLEKTVELVGN